MMCGHLVSSSHERGDELGGLSWQYRGRKLYS
jgi:hypothetical protein